MAQTQNSISPFSKPYKDIYIVNSHYNQYGQSVLPNYSKSILSNYPSHYSQQSRYSYHDPTRSRESLISSRSHPQKSPLAANEDQEILMDHDDDHEDEIVELNSNHFQTATSSTAKKSKFNYRSLISPDNKVKRFLNRLDADSFSIFSIRSNHSTPLANIRDLPLEVMKLIIFYIQDYKTLVNCLYVNKQFYKSTKFILYENPFLTSTYRVAQLITTLRQNPENGEMVKKLNLSKLEPGTLQVNPNSFPTDLDQINDDDSINSENEDNFPQLEYAYASWRDWKYRGDPLYGSSMLNSYNLSKSKSSSSVNSLSTVSSMKIKLLKQIKSNAESFNEDFNNKFKLFGTKIMGNFQRKKKSKVIKTQNKLKRKIGETCTNGEFDDITLQKSDSLKQVKINLKNPKNQPFVEGHPYTNKFLLKYSNSKDLPIGYVLYFLDLCPNLSMLDLSKISLSSDFKIVYNESVPHYKIPSLVDNVFPINSNSDSDSLNSDKKMIPMYLSDSNVYFNIKTFQNQFIKLYESDILEKLADLENLTFLNLNSISWLNFRSLKFFKQTSKSIENNSLKSINLLNSGMIRGLTWAQNFNDINEFISYFDNDHQPEFNTMELTHENVMRNVGMNY